MTWRLEIIPPPGEIGRVAVESDRRVLVGVELRKGHMDRECLNNASIVQSINDSCLLTTMFSIVELKLLDQEDDCSELRRSQSGEKAK